MQHAEIPVTCQFLGNFEDITCQGLHMLAHMNPGTHVRSTIAIYIAADQQLTD